MLRIYVANAICLWVLSLGREGRRLYLSAHRVPCISHLPTFVPSDFFTLLYNTPTQNQCEVCGIVAPPSGSEQQPRILIPDLSIELVREWYLSYIDLLQQMCLFSHAAALIGSCSDPAVGALNQQSTTIHESCPSCGKPLDSTATSDKDDGDVKVGLSTQRVCKRCRKQVGLCFLCHQVVKGMYVWCPGCGHGGHLQHALEWFGGTEEQPPQELCPTGCGHRCNLLQRLRAFPEDAQTASMTCIPIGGGE